MLYKSGDGGIKQRKVFKDKMLSIPPPVPTSLKGVIPHVFEFFHSSLFLWLPVGVLNAKIRCPNTNCSASPESFLIKSGFGASARQVCSMTTYYTLLTVRLKCPYCKKERPK